MKLIQPVYGLKSEALKNKVADIVSFAPRAYQGQRGATYDSARKVLKDAKAYDSAPDFDDNGPTDAFKTRTMAKVIRDKYTNK